MQLRKPKIITIIIIGAFIFTGAYFVLGGFGTSGPSSAPNLEEHGLVGYWNMEEGKGQTVYDRSGNSNNGTLGANSSVGKDDPVFTGGYSSAGSGGTALQFDGKDDYVSLPTMTDVSINSNYSISLWANVIDTSSTQNIFSTTISSSDRSAIYIASNIIRGGTYNGSTFIGVSGTISLGWNHIVFVRQTSGTYYLYLNAVSQVGTNIPATYSIAGSAIGSYSNGGGNFFNGSIDEVRIYNRALSADEIRQHYNQKKPILDMKFDEGSGTSTKDESFNNNDGTLNLGTGGNTTTSQAWVSGKYGSAISFDGTDDYVDVGDIADIPDGANMTWEAWIKINTNGTNVILSKKPDTYSQRYDFNVDSNGKLRFFYRVTDTTQYTVTSNTALGTSSWYYVAATKNQAIISLYINGILDKSQTASNLGVQTAQDLRIGVGYFWHTGDVWYDEYFNGTIDDVRIYNYARTQDEILADYNAGKAAHLGKDNQRDDGLVGYWNMEEGTGQTVYDRSGNGNNGTLGVNSSVGKDDPVFTSGYSSSGPGGTGLKFDGVNHYVVVDKDLVSNDMTYELWLNPNSTAWQLITQNGNGAGWGPGPEVKTSIQDSSFYFTVSSVYNGGNDVSFSTSISLSTWTHIAATISSNGQAYLYKNGIQVASDTWAGSINKSTYNFNNFRISGRDGRRYNGSIDEVRIYNRALSADEIRQHYNQKKPVLDMKFDEGSGTSTKDESFNNNDGTLNLGSGGNTTVANAWVQGKYGSAISFDGTDDYISIPAIAGNSGTLSAWVKTSVDTCGSIVGMAANSTNWMTIHIGNGCTGYLTNELITISRDEGGRTIRGGYTTATRTELIDGNWHYVSVTSNGTVYAIYLDGVLKPITVGDGSNDGQWFGSGITPTIGRIGNFYNGATNYYYFSGLIDEVRIYNYARTQDEILADYNAGKAAHLGKDNQRDDGLVGYWNMEEGTGQTVYDRSGNGNNGTLGASTAVAKDDPVFTGGYSSSGPGGTGLKFDGVDDYVLLTNNSILSAADSSMSIWFKMNIVSYDMLVGRSTNSNPFIGIQSATNIRMRNDAGTSYIDFTVPTISANNWYHLAVVRNNNITRTYLNGVESTSGGQSLVDNITINQIGRLVDGVGFEWSYFNGLIDEVRIYNRALSADEIRQHYNQKKPILEMKFDEGSGQKAYDESFNNNDGWLGGTSAVEASDPTWTSGKFGSALSFDGVNDYVDCGNGASLNQITSGVTVEAWINSSATNNRYGTVLGTGNLLTDQNGYTVSYADRYTDKKIRFYFNRYASNKYVDSNTSLNDNTWYYIVGTYDGSTMKIYINGIEENHKDSVTLQANTNYFYIGREQGDTSTARFKGTIDEPRIYNYARSADEIRVDYNAGLAAHLR